MPSSKTKPIQIKPDDSRFNVINIGLANNNRTIYERIIYRSSSSLSSSLNGTTTKSQTSYGNNSNRILLSMLWIRHIERIDQGTIIRCQSTNSPQVPQSKSLNKLFKINVNCMCIFWMLSKNKVFFIENFFLFVFSFLAKNQISSKSNKSTDC